jgi:carboxyl-terminal processing protease
VLIERLKKENIQGLVMDLRRNGGGSLEEAVNLTGLFIKSGPVVMARDSDGRAKELRDRDTSVTYDGPMIVLANKLSASASEIFAAALQDYNRAVVVGDSSTFGKGTVQTIIPLENMMPLSLSGRDSENAAGALKLTIQKFYRISGGSTQLQGVVSDVKLPSLWDQTDIGESALKGPMPYDTIPAAKYEPVEKPLYKEQLKQRALARIAKEQEFRWIHEDAERSKGLVAENKVSLNEKKRRAELDENKARTEKRNAERAKVKAAEEKVFAVTLDNVSKPELELKKEKPKAVVAKKTEEPLVNQTPEIAKEVPKTKPSTPSADDDTDDEDAPAEVSKSDPIRNETLHILTDLIEFGHKAPPALPATAATQKGAASDKN